jgi:hypothetical protein
VKGGAAGPSAEGRGLRCGGGAGGRGPRGGAWEARGSPVGSVLGFGQPFGSALRDHRPFQCCPSAVRLEFKTAVYSIRRASL